MNCLHIQINYLFTYRSCSGPVALATSERTTSAAASAVSGLVSAAPSRSTVVIAASSFTIAFITAELDSIMLLGIPIVATGPSAACRAASDLLGWHHLTAPWAAGWRVIGEVAIDNSLHLLEFASTFIVVGSSDYYPFWKTFTTFWYWIDSNTIKNL